jgi:hypothetical protein
VTGLLAARIAAGLTAPVEGPVAAFAADLAEAAGALAVLFYGSNLRTGSLDGVLDYYVLLPGPPERGMWPTVSYHERELGGVTLRAKVATMTMAKFAEAASGDLLDTTIWARFVQPSALVWQQGGAAVKAVGDALAAAAVTAGRLAAALGPARGSADDFWAALFRATYKAEFRVERAGRERDILSVNAAHFDGLLPLAWDAGGIAFARDGDLLAPNMPPADRVRILRWWARRRRFGKMLNLARLVRASTTFEGAARYAAWKIERHTGVPVKLTPWRERHPLLAAPGVMLSIWRQKRRRG